MPWRWCWLLTWYSDFICSSRFPVWQQSFFLLFLLAIYQLPLLWLSGWGARRDPILAWQAIISGSLVWPLIFALMRSIQGRYGLF